MAGPDLNTLTLSVGSHEAREDGVCIMEAAAWLAGEEHSDQPSCVSPVIRTYAMGLNDGWNDATRQRLLPYISLVIGTAQSVEVEQRRSWMAVDWMARIYAPVWLRLANLRSHAAVLEALGAITDGATARQVRPVLGAAWDTARTAPGRQLGTAQWAAAQLSKDAGWAAADAAIAAAWAGGIAAEKAAGTAGDAASAAGVEVVTRDATWEAHRRTVDDALQNSALSLLERMAAAGRR